MDKMTKKILLFVLAVIVLQLSVFAQEKRVYVAKGMATIMVKTSGYYEQTSFHDSFWKMDSDFKYGIVYMKNGDSIDDIGLRFNITLDRFEVKINNKEGIYILNPDSVSHIKRMEEEFVYSKYYDKAGDLAKGYFNVVYNGQTRLLFKKKEIHKSGKHGAYGHNPYKTFSTEYYIQGPEAQYPIWVKLKEKPILDALGASGPALDVYAKENGLRFSKTHELVKILAYYDQLNSKQL